jgi:hypothetical protein
VPDRDLSEPPLYLCQNHADIVWRQLVKRQPLREYSIRVQRSGRQFVELGREEIADTRDPRIGGLRDDDVIGLPGNVQEVACIVFDNADLGMLPAAAIVVLKPGRGADDGRFDL